MVYAHAFVNEFTRKANHHDYDSPENPLTAPSELQIVRSPVSRWRFFLDRVTFRVLALVLACS